MQEIAQYTLSYEHYNEVMSMLWKRMFQEKENWRITYKVRDVLNALKSESLKITKLTYYMIGQVCFNR